MIANGTLFVVVFNIFGAVFSVGEENWRRKGRRGRERERESLGMRRKEEIYERVFPSDFNEHVQNPNFWNDGD